MEHADVGVDTRPATLPIIGVRRIRINQEVLNKYPFTMAQPE